MPEGPELYILSHAINCIIGPMTITRGKQLFFCYPSIEKWSFGLHGGIHLDDNGNFTKTFNGNICGDIHTIQDIETEINKLGPDFMMSIPSDIHDEIKKWKGYKKKLSGLMLTQTKIAGIGVAWGSEILHACKLKPNIRASNQDLTELGQKICNYRDYIKKEYIALFNKYCENSSAKSFINEWPRPLYVHRERMLNVYKKGQKILITGRTWWVKEESDEVDGGMDIFTLSGASY
jgi:hypothetical protein